MSLQPCSIPVVPAAPVTPADEEAAADPFKWKIRKGWAASDGTSHIGSSLSQLIANRPFPGELDLPRRGGGGER
jgi:hypothetical protein